MVFLLLTNRSIFFLNYKVVLFVNCPHFFDLNSYIQLWLAVVVAQLVEWLLPNHEVCGSNPVIINIYFESFLSNCIEKTKITKKVTENGPFLRDFWIRIIRDRFAQFLITKHVGMYVEKQWRYNAQIYWLFHGGNVVSFSGRAVASYPAAREFISPSSYPRNLPRATA